MLSGRSRRKWCNVQFGLTLLLVFLVYVTVITWSADDGMVSYEPGLVNRKLSPVTSHPVATLPVRRVTIPNNCSDWFKNTFEENLDVIRRYPRGLADQYMDTIGGNTSRPERMVTSFPVIVTASSANYFATSQNLLKSIEEFLRPTYGDIKVIYYDLGLRQEQLTQLTEDCNNCEVRKFPFSDVPDHVSKLHTYTWKPLIIQKLLMEFGWVWWMDSSVRLVTGQLDAALNYSRENSFLFFTYGSVLSVAQHTDVQTMEYLGEDGCKYRYFGEIEAGFVLYHFDNVTKSLVNAWAACALNSECMCPPGTAKKKKCWRKGFEDGDCHRFDQAVLSILLRRLYHDNNDYPLVDVPFHIHVIRRGSRVGRNYFKERQKRKRNAKISGT